MVAGQAQLGAVGQDPGELVQGLGLDQPALVVAGLAPGIGEEREGPADRGLGQDGQQLAAVALEDPDVLQVLGLDPGQQAGDAVDEDLGAEEAGVPVARRLPGQVLAGAEADLQPERRGPRLEEAGEVERGGFGQGDRQTWQQALDQGLAAPAQLAAVAPAVELCLVLGRGVLGRGSGSRGFALGRSEAQRLKAERRSSTRSSRSQEKPPSGSGARPKWP